MSGFRLILTAALFFLKCQRASLCELLGAYDHYWWLQHTSNEDL